jgi:hypothetical protein
MSQRSIDKYASAGERAHACNLVKQLIADGFTLAVNDGEEWTVTRCTDADTVIDALATTGEDYLKVFRSEDDVHSTLQLIWGNCKSGMELVADYSFGTDYGLKVVDDIIDKVYNQTYPKHSSAYL